MTKLLPQSKFLNTSKTYNVSRYKIKEILFAASTKTNIRESDLCLILERSYQCYWDRFDKKTWYAENVYALCYVLSNISNGIVTPEMIISKTK